MAHRLTPRRLMMQPASVGFGLVLLRFFLRGLCEVQATIDRLTGFPLQLGFGVDITITAASVLASASATIVKQYLAGATITTGQAVYLGAASTWLLIDSDAAVTGNELATTKGIALVSAASGQPMDVCVRDTDFTPGGTLTNGSTVYTSVTAGGITLVVPDASDYPTVLGVAKSTTKMNLNPTSSGVVI